MVKSINSYDIALIFANVFSAYITKKFLCSFLKKSRNNRITCLAYVAYGIATTLSSVIFDIPILNLSVTMAGLILIVFTYEETDSKRILSATFCCSLLVGAEVFFSAVTGIIEISPIAKGEYGDIFGLFMCKMGTFFFVLLIENGKFYIGKNAPPFIYLLVTIFTPTASMVISAMIVSIHGTTKTIVCVSIALLTVINVITFMLYDKISVYYEKQLETATIKRENTYYYNQCVVMKQSTEETSRFRHDIHNHFTMIEGFLKSNKIREAQSYLENLKKKERETEKSLVDTGNVIVDSILNHKLSLLKDEVKPELEIIIPKELNIETVHLVSILTNLLDNALEALAKCSENEKLLRIRIVYDKGRLLIGIQNSYVHDVIYENGKIISSKENSNEHGMGLKNAFDAIEHYNGLMKIDHTQKIFSVKALLYVS